MKLHASLTRRLAAGEPPSADLSALLGATSEMDVGVIAECVEEPYALPRLRALTIGYIQGFAIYEPRPIQAFAQAQAQQAA